MTLNFFLSVVFGLMGGIGLAFFVEYFDNTIKDTQEIEKEHAPSFPRHDPAAGQYSP